MRFILSIGNGLPWSSVLARTDASHIPSSPAMNSGLLASFSMFVVLI